MILREVLGKTKDHFTKLGFASAKVDSELLLATALGWKRLDLYLKQEYPLSDKELNDCREMVRRRSKGEPVAYILGYKDFYSIQLKVTAGVLIPRPETEHLVDEAINYCKNSNLSNPVVLDLGSGSGCVGLAVAKEVPKALVVLVEKSEAAFKILLENIKLNQLEEQIIAIHSSVEDFNENILKTALADYYKKFPHKAEQIDLAEHTSDAQVDSHQLPVENKSVLSENLSMSSEESGDLQLITLEDEVLTLTKATDDESVSFEEPVFETEYSLEKQQSEDEDSLNLRSKSELNSGKDEDCVSNINTSVDKPEEYVNSVKEHLHKLKISDMASSSVSRENLRKTFPAIFDIVLSNPPYIEVGDKALAKDVLEFEPSEALFAEEQGTKFYRTWPDHIKNLLKPNSLLAFEIGFEQGQKVLDIFKAKSFLKNSSVIKDYSTNDRIVRAYKQGE
ncbi:MAG: HemK/PrmC family methyltransferase [Bdellovibrionota bacterium]|nr:HemK/PrmC family methyltransferase [Bdellovibrionota bacterium]